MSYPSPIVICGCHGGGTSYIAKLLRYAGLFIGHDAGPRWVVKFHESRAFRLENERMLFEFGGERNGLNPGAVAKAVAALARDENITLAVQRVDLALLRKEFWARQPAVPWGWKDPRNSLTYPVWNRIFPGAKALIVTKLADEASPRSTAGYRFPANMTPWLRDAYMKPAWEPDFSTVMRAPFEEITRHPTALNDVLKFCDLPTVSREQFHELLKRTRFGKDEYLWVRLYSRLVRRFGGRKPRGIAST